MNRLPIFLIFLALDCGSKQEKIGPVTAITQAPRKSVLMVIAPSDFRDEEFKAPYDLLTKSGVKVTVASTDTLPAKGMLGMVVRPEITFDQVNLADFNGLVIVGGSGAQVLWDDATLHRIVQGFNDSKKTVAAICISPVVLARAGVLKDKKATVCSDVKDELIKCGANYSGADVEISGNIITASGPHAAKAFADAVLKALNQP